MPKPLNALQTKAVGMIADGKTEAEVAVACGKSRSWVQQLKRRDDVQGSVEETKATIHKTIRSTHLECVEKVTVERTQAFFSSVHSELQNAATDAIRFLVDTMNDPDARHRDRIDAAKEIIKISGVVEIQKVPVEHEVRAEREQGKQEKPKGLSEETAAQIRAQILGMV